MATQVLMNFKFKHIVYLLLTLNAFCCRFVFLTLCFYDKMETIFSNNAYLSRHRSVHGTVRRREKASALTCAGSCKMTPSHPAEEDVW